MSNSAFFWLFLVILIYSYSWYRVYKQTKSKSITISKVKKDIKLLVIAFSFGIVFYWIVDKYQEATDLSNLPKQKVDEKLFIPLSEEEKKEFENLNIHKK